jgi:ribosomal protein S21
MKKHAVPGVVVAVPLTLHRRNHIILPETRLPKEGSTLAVGVKVRNNESIDRALKRFRRQVNRSRILREYRQNMAYMKPSEEKRLKKKKARRRRHRERKRGDNRKRR